MEIITNGRKPNKNLRIVPDLRPLGSRGGLEVLLHLHLRQTRLQPITRVREAKRHKTIKRPTTRKPITRVQQPPLRVIQHLRSLGARGGLEVLFHLRKPRCSAAGCI
jgi:hypothetical protein